MFEQVVNFIRDIFDRPDGLIPLHEPRFTGMEKEYVLDCIDSTYVSSVGKYVDQFEAKIAEYTGTEYAVAVVNGTAGLHMALHLAGVRQGSLVITQPLTFVATCNAITYCGADSVFVDIDRSTLGLSAEKLEAFLEEHSLIDKAGQCYHKESRKPISACLPMHTYGHPAEIDRIVDVCKQYHIPVVEDAAEAIGSRYKEQHAGTFGLLGVFSFNGNKTITCGGGGAIVTDNEDLAKKCKHLTTQAKIIHKWEFTHDQVGYNYRMPNLNAAFACAQLEALEAFIDNKRELSKRYGEFFAAFEDLDFYTEPKHARSNYWLNAILLKDQAERDNFLKYTNEKGIMTRPAWHLMHDLKMYKECVKSDTSNADYIFDKLVSIPSSVRNI